MSYGISIYTVRHVMQGEFRLMYGVLDVIHTYGVGFWPTPTEAQRAKIKQTAQTILDARAIHQGSPLSVMYDEVTMHKELRKAHQDNDRVVMQAYGFPVSKDFTESDCVARLLEM